jgi:hypothetical protein
VARPCRLEWFRICFYAPIPERFPLAVSPPTLSATNAERMGHPSVLLFDQREQLGRRPSVSLFGQREQLGGRGGLRLDWLCAGGLGFLHQAPGLGDQVGYFERFHQAGHAFFQQESTNIGLGDAGERKQ